MLIFKKLCLLVCLALGMSVPNALADALIDHKINAEVKHAFCKPVPVAALRSVLQNNLLPKIVVLIQPKVDTDYKNLNEALKNLNFEEKNLIVVLGQLKNVVNLLPTESKELLQKRYPILNS